MPRTRTSPPPAISSEPRRRGSPRRRAASSPIDAGRSRRSRPRPPPSKLAHARVQSAQAALDLAKLAARLHEDHAPIAGFVSKLAAHDGQMVQPGMTLVMVVPAKHVRRRQLQGDPDRSRSPRRCRRYLGRRPRRHRAPRPGREHRRPGTGARFSMMPPDNATGNFVKVVQRVPVKIELDQGQDTSQAARRPLRRGQRSPPTLKTCMKRLAAVLFARRRVGPCRCAGAGPETNVPGCDRDRAGEELRGHGREGGGARLRGQDVGREREALGRAQRQREREPLPRGLRAAVRRHDVHVARGLHDDHGGLAQPAAHRARVPHRARRCEPARYERDAQRLRQDAARHRLQDRRRVPARLAARAPAPRSRTNR